jgi:hypothetical protein
LIGSSQSGIETVHIPVAHKDVNEIFPILPLPLRERDPSLFGEQDRDPGSRIRESKWRTFLEGLFKRSDGETRIDGRKARLGF